MSFAIFAIRNILWFTDFVETVDGPVNFHYWNPHYFSTQKLSKIRGKSKSLYGEMDGENGHLMKNMLKRRTNDQIPSSNSLRYIRISHG